MTPAPTEENTISGIIDFWFDEKNKPKWFNSDEAFDEELRIRFSTAYEAARKEALNSWKRTPQGALALVLLLDQIPRNIHRGTPASFASDEAALSVSRETISQGLDQQLPAVQRQFLYLPYMHSETLQDQEDGLRLYERLGLAEPLDFMHQHHKVIIRFGRFPHRNSILARPSTQEEIAFLQQPGSSF